MSFWEKIFGKKKQEISKRKESYFDEDRRELQVLGLESKKDLEDIVKPIIRSTTLIIPKKSSRPPENSQLKNHFGGQPYFEEGENWPENKSGKSLDFIFQIYNKKELELPDEIKLIQFYYDWDEFPWDTENDGWLVKIYKELNPEKRYYIPKLDELEKSKYCEIKFKQTKSLPDWEGIDLFENNASKLSCVLDENEPWKNYDEIVEKLVGEQEYQSQLSA